MKDLLYVITREGVYRHEILGVFSDKQKAIESASIAINEEKDNYHEIHVGTIEPDKLVDDIRLLISFKRDSVSVYVYHWELESSDNIRDWVRL